MGDFWKYVVAIFEQTKLSQIKKNLKAYMSAFEKLRVKLWDVKTQQKQCPQDFTK